MKHVLIICCSTKRDHCFLIVSILSREANVSSLGTKPTNCLAFLMDLVLGSEGVLCPQLSLSAEELNLYDCFIFVAVGTKYAFLLSHVLDTITYNVILSRPIYISFPR